MISIRKVLFLIIGISLAFGIITGFVIGTKKTTVIIKTHVITKVVYKYKTKTKTIKGPTTTVTVYRNGYAHIGDDPLWNCAGNWYNAYIRLANNSNMPAGDSGLWNYYCPGIPQPGN